MNWYYEQPVSITFGNGKIADLNQLARRLHGHNGLLVTSPHFRQSGLADRLVSQSEGMVTGVFAAVSPNPDVAEVDACADVIRKDGHDFLIALGGGSVMDCAKAAASAAMTEDSITRYHGTGLPLPPQHLPLIAVPTTSGTGSEVTCVSVLTNHALGKKVPIVSQNFYPNFAIVDPELTYSLPPSITASTGLDVLCHAVEGFWSKGHQPICDACAVHAADLVFRYVKAAYDRPDDREAREKMAEASVVAGLAFTLPKTTSSHACSFPLTNRYGIPHGEACALTLDYFARVNQDAQGGRIREFARRLGFSTVEAMASRIGALKREMGMRTDLKEFQLTDRDIELLAEESLHPNLAYNPVEITRPMLVEMYQSMR